MTKGSLYFKVNALKNSNGHLWKIVHVNVHERFGPKFENAVCWRFLRMDEEDVRVENQNDLAATQG